MTRFSVESVARLHSTGSAQSRRRRIGRPRPYLRRRHGGTNWLLIVGVILSYALFFLPISTAGNVEQLSYTQVKSAGTGWMAAFTSVLAG